MSFVLEDCLTPKWKNAFHQALALHTASFFFMAFINAWYYGIITYIYVCLLFIVCLPFPLKALSVRAGALPWTLSSRAPMPLSYFKILECIETWCVTGRAKLLRANRECRKGVKNPLTVWSDSAMRSKSHIPEGTTTSPPVTYHHPQPRLCCLFGLKFGNTCYLWNQHSEHGK